jgi:CubicO group peptidase (beta-lactamase class C family)
MKKSIPCNVYPEVHHAEVNMSLFRKLRGKRSSSPPLGSDFDLDSPIHREQLNRLLDISHTPQVSIYFEVLGEVPQTTTLHYPLPQSSPDDFSSQTLSAPQGSYNAQASSEVRDLPTSQTSPKPPIDTIYAITSYTKILVNVAYARLLRHKQYKHLGLSWETPVCDIFNEMRERNGKSTIKRLWGDPNLRQLLIHENGIAPMNRFLFAPDGAFIVSEDEFIAVAPLITEDFYKDKYPHRGWVDHSNGNHILAGILLEEVTGRELHDLMHELVFDSLNMTHSVMSEQSLATHAIRTEVAVGHRGSANKSQVISPSGRYLSDVVEVAALGARSSPEDLAKLHRTFLKGAEGDSESIFEKSEISDFFRPDCLLRDGAVTLAGLFSSLDSRLSRDDSLNRILMPIDDFSPFVLGRRRDGSDCKVYSKAGAVDGFTCGTYLLLKDRTFVLVFANSSGPVEITDYIARYIMQEAVPLFPRVDIVSKAFEEGQMCLSRLQDMERKDLRFSKLSGDVEDLVGTYQHVRYLQQITITRDATVTIHGKTKTSSPMKLVRVAPKLVRILPGASGFGIERWSVWDDLEFVVTIESTSEVALVGKKWLDRYLRID